MMIKKIITVIGVMLFIMISNAYSEIIIIANKNVPDTELSRAELRDIFLGKVKMWGNNSDLLVSIRTDNKIFKEFTLKYMECTPSFFVSHWKTMIFTGRAVFPKRFKSREGMLDYVASTEGAIGYIESSSDLVDVKIVKIK